MSAHANVGLRTSGLRLGDLTLLDISEMPAIQMRFYSKPLWNISAKGRGEACNRADLLGKLHSLYLFLSFISHISSRQNSRQFTATNKAKVNPLTAVSHSNMRWRQHTVLKRYTPNNLKHLILSPTLRETCKSNSVQLRVLSPVNPSHFSKRWCKYLLLFSRDCYSSKLPFSYLFH